MGLAGKFVKCGMVSAVLFGVILPALVSHLIGGWTREYFTPSFTPSWKLKDIEDMTGKVVLVTGGNTGIGKETGRELARAGAKVFITCRSEKQCQAAVDNIKESVKGKADVTPMSMDLSSFQSIDDFSKAFLDKGLPLDVLVNNAGVMKSPGEMFMGQQMSYGYDTTKEGFEYHMGVNHLGHFKLTSNLLEALKTAKGRVVAVSSAAEEGAPPKGIDFDTFKTGATMPAGYEDGVAYGQSKLANVLFAQELAQRMEKEGVSAYSCHPGVIKTDLGRYMIAEMERASKGDVLKAMANAAQTTLFDQAMFSASGGALTQIHLATAKKDSLVNGGYYVPVGHHESPKHPMGSNNAKLRKELWEQSEAATRG